MIYFYTTLPCGLKKHILKQYCVAEKQMFQEVLGVISS